MNLFPQGRLHAAVACLALASGFNGAQAQAPAASGTAGDPSSTNSDTKSEAQLPHGKEQTPTANPLGVSPPLGAPLDPFADLSKRGHLVGGINFIPVASLAMFHDNNPQLSTPNSLADSARVLTLALGFVSAKPGALVGYVTAANTTYNSQTKENETDLTATAQTTLVADGWTVPIGLSYSRNKLAWGSLLSESSSSGTLSERQTATSTSLSASGTKKFGLSEVTLSANVSALDVDTASFSSGTSQDSTADHDTYTLNAKLARPLMPGLQWYVRWEGDQYRYAQSQPLYGSHDSTESLVAVGTELGTPTISGSVEIGSSHKNSASSLVPDSTSTVGGINVKFTPAPNFSATVGYNRVTFETNIPGVSNALVTSLSSVVNYRFAQNWIFQLMAAKTLSKPQPIDAEINDRSVSLTLLWKATARTMLALSVSDSQRTTSPSIASTVNGYKDRKVLGNLVFFF